MTKLDWIRSVPFFSRLSLEHLKKIEPILMENHYQKDEVVFLEKDPCDRAFILKSGRVKASKYSLDGKEFIASFFKPGDFFGEACLFASKNQYLVTTTACEESVIYSIQKSDMKDFILHNPEVALVFIEVFSNKLVYLIGELDDMAFKNVRIRLIQMILDLIPDEMKHKASGFELTFPFSRSEIAAKLGTVREQVSRILSRLAHEGLIAINGKNVKIIDERRLRDGLF